jgi:hypothetical protein
MARPRIAIPTPWGAGAGVCFVLVVPVLVWSEWLGGDISERAGLVVLALIGAGAACFTVATALRSRAEHASFLRTLGRTLAAPIRFFLELP